MGFPCPCLGIRRELLQACLGVVFFGRDIGGAQVGNVLRTDSTLVVDDALGFFHAVSGYDRLSMSPIVFARSHSRTEAGI